MTQTTDRAQAHEPYVARFQQFAGNGAATAPAWVTEKREAAIERFAEAGFPTTRLEAWRFTDIKPLLEATFDPMVHEVPDAAAVTGLHCGDPSAVAVVANGRWAGALASGPALPDGVVVGSLADAIAAGHPAVEQHLSASGIDGRTAFGALNTAFLADGAFVYVPRGVQVSTPIHVVVYSSGTDALTTGRVLVVLEEGAAATLVETHAGADGQRYWSAPITEYVVHANAHLDAYRLQRESAAAFHTAGIHSRVERDATCSLITMSFGAALSRQDIVAVLDGTGAETTVNGLSILGARQHVDYHTELDHAEPHCNSWEYFNGVFGERARGVFTGRIIVRPGAQKTDAKQTNNNLLLSSQARADSQPQLEIYADDVRCTHGATLGPIDDEHLFYLQSRGLSREAARNLLTYGFASEIIRGARYEGLATWLDGFVQERLASLTGEASPAT